MTDELRKHLERHLAWGGLEGDERLRFLALALCGEAGELANLVKKGWRSGGDYREQIEAELVDCANYLAMLAMHMGIDIEAAMLRKLIEVERRPEWKAGRGIA